MQCCGKPWLFNISCCAAPCSCSVGTTLLLRMESSTAKVNKVEQPYHVTRCEKHAVITRGEFVVIQAQYHNVLTFAESLPKDPKFPYTHET